METYSFLDTILNVVFPFGAMSITGKGVGNITVSMSQQRSAIDRAADGNIMISKIAGNDGVLTLSIQQTSDAHKFLLAMYNALIIAPPSAWAQGAAILRAISDNTTMTFTGLCFQKLPDKPYDMQGAKITWTLLAGDVQQMPF